MSDYKAKYEALNRLHKSANLAIDSLQNQIATLQGELLQALTINENLEKKMLIQKETLVKVITENNQNEQEQVGEIQRLRGLVHEARSA